MTSTTDPPTTESRSSALPASAIGSSVGWLDGPLPWIVLLATALAARLAFVFFVPPRLMWPDPIELEAVARMLYERGTYGLQTLRPPGYPTFIAGVYHLFGPNLVALRLVEAVLATVSVGLIGALGMKLFGRRAGLVAAGIAALHPMLAFMPATTYSESTSVLLMALLFTVAFRAADRGGGWLWAVAGLLLGMQTLIRPNAIALLPGLGLGFAFLLRRARRGWVVPVLVTGVTFALTLTPWLVRNHAVHDRWFFVSTGGGRQLWLGNNPNSTSITNQDVIIDAQTLADLEARPGFFAKDQYFYAKAVEFIRTQPGAAARLYVRKLGNIFALYPETLTGTYVNPASRISQAIATVVLFAGVLLGLRHWRREPGLWPLACSSLTFVLATALAFSSMRYRLMVEPALILVAGLGFARMLPGNSR